MCGIAGILGRTSNSVSSLAERLAAMTGAQRHRGPDGSGIWTCPVAPLVLGHRRLAIIDLTEAGHQPMASGGGQLEITYNGEIYNFAAVKAELDAACPRRWRGHSDTEVLVEAIATWGLTAAVSRFNGMFAFALWNQPDRTVSLVRDRLGVKPLHVARSGDGAVIFGSEIRALAADPLFPTQLNHAALPSYFAYGYLPRVACIYQDTVSLAPGSMVSFAADAGAIDWAGFQAAARLHPAGPFDLRGAGWHYCTYWSAAQSWQRGKERPFSGSFEEAVAEGETLVADAVQRRLVADVPLGALLSGGVDSSLVVALMRQSCSRVRTFSIGFADAAFDESGHAEAVARHLGTDHTTLRVGEPEALEAAGHIGHFLDEPLADASFVPTYLVSRLTRRHVTVAMTGDGGDEYFCGYWRYREFGRLDAAYKLPNFVRSATDMIARHLEIQPPDGRGARWMYYRLIRLLRLAAQPDFTSAYRYGTTTTYPMQHLLSVWSENSVANYQEPHISELGLAELMMHMDVLHYLPDDLLVKMDRASMAVSLECREPLLDYRLHEFSARLPIGFKLERSAGKRLLRHILYRHVPRELIDRPKQGFTPPLARWLRHELKQCVEQTLFDGGKGSELFARDALASIWQQHQGGRWNHANVLWSVFVLRQWLATHRWN